MSTVIHEIKIGEKAFQLRELTTREVDELFARLDLQQSPNSLDWLFAKDFFPSAAMEAICGISAQELIAFDFPPSSLVELYKEAEKLNPFLKKAIVEMQEIARAERLLNTTGLESLQSLLSTEDFMGCGTIPSASSSKPSGSSATVPENPFEK